MPKRMTDTDKWKKPFIKSLPLEYKIFWLYLLDDCDHAGIWHTDFEVAGLRLGTTLSQKKAEGLFSEKVVLLDDGTKWFIPDFISFQYGVLNPQNRAHASVIHILTKYSLIDYLKEKKVLESPLQGAKDKAKDKDMDKDQEPPPQIVSIEMCLIIAMNDPRWVNANKVTKSDLEQFNKVLEKRGVYDKNPYDYKTHYANWTAGGKKENWLEPVTAPPGQLAAAVQAIKEQRLNG